MALTYNGVSPTSINYKGTSLNVVKYGNTAVWGKPFSLSISAGSNTTITVNRTSSPNQHASTGNLSSGAVIYYGDTLTISYSVSSGYNIDTHTVNGAAFTSGSSFTVTSGISVVTTAVSAASWHTVWTGKMKIAGSNYTSVTTVSVSGFNLRTGVPTRVTIGWEWYEEYWSWETNDITTTTEIGQYVKQKTLSTRGTYENDFEISTAQPTDTNYPYCMFGLQSISQTSLGFKVKNLYNKSDYYSITLGDNFGIIPGLTKVEQYY